MSELRPYQEVARNFLLAKPRAILGDHPGTGKTPVALASLAQAGAARALIVCPNNVVTHWQALAREWWPGALVVDGRGAAGDRAEMRDYMRLVEPGIAPLALVLNYEAMRIDVEELAKIPFDSAVFDEGHRLKNRRALQTRAAWKLARRIPRVWVLSGTLPPNRPDELWSLLHMLYPRYWPSYWRWVNQHMVADLANFGGRMVKVVIGVRPGAIEAIRAELAPVMLQRTVDELLPDLPAVTTTVLEVSLDAQERKAYDDLKRRHWTQLEDGTVIQSVNEVSRLTRFRQIVSDMEALGATRTKPGSKIAATLELCSDLDPEQVLVLTWSRAAAERVADEAGGACVHGGFAVADRAQALANFKMGKVRVLAGTLATLGEGVDGLQVARHVILLDRPWRPSEEDQAIGRIRRSGQVAAVNAYFITAAGTIDQKISKLLAQKRSVIEAIRVGEIEP